MSALSYLTDAELVHYVDNSPTANDVMNELAGRLHQAVVFMEGIDRVMDILDKHDIDPLTESGAASLEAALSLTTEFKDARELLEACASEDIYDASGFKTHCQELASTQESAQ